MSLLLQQRSLPLGYLLDILPESNVVNPEEYCNEKLCMHLFAEQLLWCNLWLVNLCVFDFTVSRAIGTGINSVVNEEVYNEITQKFTGHCCS